MKQVFTHPEIDTYTFENVPLNQDIYLMDEKWMIEYDDALTKMFSGGDYANAGYISYAAARAINASAIELSWYANVSSRFHEIKILLPRHQFVTCIGSDSYEVKPHIFVKTDWISSLHLRAYSVFAMVDAIGVKSALAGGKLTRDKLIKLRDRIDDIAKENPSISFISFADSLLMKSNWFVGQYDSEVKYNYEPEIFIRLILEIKAIYLEILGMNVYAVLTQGANEFYDDALLHISSTRNHISLNSLGVPFAQIMAIENAARAAIKKKIHEPKELYMDKNFYHSLRFNHKFNKNAGLWYIYQSPMIAGDSHYFYEDCGIILDNLLQDK